MVAVQSEFIAMNTSEDKFERIMLRFNRCNGDEIHFLIMSVKAALRGKRILESLTTDETSSDETS